MTAPAAVPAADFSRVDPRAVALLPERWARRHKVLPTQANDARIVVATSNPLDLDAERAVGFATGRRVEWVSADANVLLREINRWYPDASEPREPAPPMEVEHLSFSTDSAIDRVEEGGASVIRLVDQLLAEGIRAGVSDIHIEPEEQGVAVRHRVDGVLRQVRTLSRGVAPSLVSRVKILSGLDIADRLRPQDGRARVAVAGSIVDLRVSTLPASHGEKIVIRVLDGSGGLRSLDTIGFSSAELRRIRSLLEQREGLILVTGPTGSGKTTTLYAALREVQARGVNIVTVEDPIEYRLQGIVQVQVHERAGLTFGAALRSIMRQDPDVILVGETRDRETAEIAIQASLTGHLVLSTLHTNDAASAVTRLIDIGVPSYQIATAVKGVVAQRLLRRRCAACHVAGCAACQHTGYRGRLAVAEVLVTNPEFERRVAAGAPTEALAEAARAGGCMSLWDSGLALVRKSETTMEELRRVAAEPVRLVAEPSGLTSAPAETPPEFPITANAPASAVTRIAWRAGMESPDARRLLVELRDAAALVRGSIDLDERFDDSFGERVPEVIVVSCERATRPPGPGALVVALASESSVSHHVRMLAGDADLVVPGSVSGRVLLATLLALVRWRGAR